MKVIVCGPVAYGNIQRIKELQNFLRQNGFKVVDQFQQGMDYSDVKDFRDKRELAVSIVKNDLYNIKNCDVIIAICDQPSFGTAVEIYYAKKLGKKIVVFSEKSVASPWPIAFSDYIVKSREELVKVLSKII